MAKRPSLTKAQKAKNDEFYTRLTDIEKEMKHYEGHFDSKHIFCNCDDPEFSDFWRYFALNFRRLNIKQLTATHYEEGESTYRMDMFRDEIPDEFKDKQTFMTLEETGIDLPLGYITPLQGDGDFRSEESIDILKECDIVATNPPFSLFREYVAQLMEYEKDFIIIGNMNAITYKEVFPLLKENKLWLGVSRAGTGSMWFRVPDDAPDKSGQKIVDGVRYQTIGNSAWFTNLDHNKRHEELILYKKYNPEEYPKYDNYNGIEVSKVVNIPIDYDGVMGVPITFLGKYNPDQFEIIKFRKGDDEKDLRVNGKDMYFRILIKKKQKEGDANED